MCDNGDILDNIDIQPTTEKSKSIHAINKQTVHQICSGQVVLNLATAVKELVENSLDAGATAVEVRLKEYGKESIEVSDNGHGVEEENFQALTLKHHTSKLRDYSDLIGVNTFGFRGEALSSLCALSNLYIITRHKSMEFGTRLEFDHNGLIVKKTPCARQIGTTVSISNIFSTLPVRQKDFHKNIKREFNKMTQLLYAYCLVANHAKITCTNQNKGSGRSIIVTTQGNKSLRDNIISVFGAKQTQNLLDIKPLETFITEPSDIVNGSNNDYKKTPFSFEGVISSCDHESGRSTTDRQFYYINSRPCEPNKIMKVVNECYKQYNTNKLPFVFLNVKVESQDVDVNVTPDKRQIFLNNEKLLLAMLKQTLIKIFENIPGTMKLQNRNLDVSSLNQMSFIGNSMKNMSKISPTKKDSTQNMGLKRKMSFLERFTSSTKNIKLSHNVPENGDVEELCTAPIQDTKTPDLSSDSDEDNGKLKSFQHIKLENIVIDTASAENVLLESNDHLEPSSYKINGFNSVEHIKSETVTPCEPSCDRTLLEESKNSFESSSFKSNPIFMPKNVTIFHESQDTLEDEIKTNIDNGHSTDSESDQNTVPSEMFPDSKSDNHNSDDDLSLKQSNTDIKSVINNYASSEEESEIIEPIKKTEDTDFVNDINRTSVEMKCTLEDIKTRMTLQSDLQKLDLNKVNRIKFRSEILPSTNESAEKELDREISKEMFSKMSIIGQFNLGFIIVQLDDDLFIIDQHASDEKFNFESLQKSTVLQNQKLVIPQTLELTAMNESILIDNMEVFERNGFQFEIDEAADARKKVKLIAIPMSKNCQFGKDDIDELLFMLQDSSGDNSACRPSRVRSMLASRACRKSVMVGTALTKPDMKRLVDNMGTMEQPWNCPHGRPTMRHLVNLYLLNRDTDE